MIFVEDFDVLYTVVYIHLCGGFKYILFTLIHEEDSYFD